MTKQAWRSNWDGAKKPVASSGYRKGYFETDAQACSWLEDLGLLEYLAPVTADLRMGVDYGAGRDCEARSTETTVPYREVPAWISMAYDTALNIGDLELNPQKHPRLRPLWRDFLLLIHRDPASINAIDSVRRMSNKVRALETVREMFETYKKKIEGAKFAQAIVSRQVMRDYRTSGRSIGLLDDAMPRPSDEEYAREFDVPTTIRARRNRQQRVRKK